MPTAGPARSYHIINIIQHSTSVHNVYTSLAWDGSGTWNKRWMDLGVSYSKPGDPQVPKLGGICHIDLSLLQRHLKSFRGYQLLAYDSRPG